MLGVHGPVSTALGTEDALCRDGGAKRYCGALATSMTHIFLDEKRCRVAARQ